MPKLTPSKETVRKLIENKSQDTTDAIKVLGSIQELYAIADFFERHAEAMHLIATNELLKYTSVNTFNSEQLDAFREGLGSIGLFFQDCWEERDIIEKKKKLRSAVPSPA